MSEATYVLGGPEVRGLSPYGCISGHHCAVSGLWAHRRSADIPPKSGGSFQRLVPELSAALESCRAAERLDTTEAG